MKFIHPAFFYHLIFKVSKPEIQKLIGEIENTIVEWPGLYTAIHEMGGVVFLYDQTEIGHIHWNGNLDIVFGKHLTSQLLRLGKIKHHNFLPESAITFQVVNREDIPFAISLLQFSYLRLLRKIGDNALMIEAYIENEIIKLPEELKMIL
ncbi:MAG TPA: luciferase family protein [Cyclobacteriaceae bacterium]|jgi:hypothetical protein|nr:luciferase family protein [Cyclobacteriaceae bacterium]